MKYITSCPQCDTRFLLNDELLKAYRGKVQCGHCQHVFNAKNRLTELADEYQATIDGTSPESTPPMEEKMVSASTEPTATEIKKEVAPEATFNIDNLKKNHKKPRQHSFLLSLIGLLLALTFILQAAYFLRGKIAAEYPQFKPILESACKQLNCTIALPQNLNLISIGDSNMQEDDTYQSVINFSSSLQNNAKHPQAYPNIELTLTDGDDIPVIKKLITPKDYLASKKKIKQGLEPHEVANIRLALHVDEPRVASYRILLLY